MTPAPDRRLCVAPMMTHTDRHFRYFLRLLSRRVMLYTEMVTTGALLHGDPAPRLRHAGIEQPLGIQLGGADPDALARCAILAQQAGFAEINLNVGCPSARVSDGRFGACLMLEPARVARCIAAMNTAVSVPVTVKTRIGVDDRDDYGALVRFVDTVAGAGCTTFIVHARKARLDGFSPRQNREIPPLRHDMVYQLKQDYPRLEIIINGGISTLSAAATHRQRVDGVMLGRAVCNNPYLLADADSRFFNDSGPVPTRTQVLTAFMTYAEQQMQAGINLQHMTRHILGLFQGRSGARHYRRYLSEHAHRPGAGVEVISAALRHVEAA